MTRTCNGWDVATGEIATRQGGHATRKQLLAILPEPAVNVRVAGHRVDALFGDDALIVELDGWATHRLRSILRARGVAASPGPAGPG